MEIIRQGEPEVFIYCDDPSHPNRDVGVTNFHSLGDGRWNEIYTSTAAQGQRESGTTLEGNKLATGMSRMDFDELRQRVHRSRYQLVCRKCRRRPVVAREENLFAVLNKLADAGVSRINLTVMAASLQRQSDGRN